MGDGRVDALNSAVAELSRLPREVRLLERRVEALEEERRAVRRARGLDETRKDARSSFDGGYAMSILGNLETMGADVIEALEPTSAPGSAPKSLSSDDIVKTLPALSAVIAWLAKESPTIQAGATTALAAMFDAPDAALGIEIAAEDIPEIVAVGQEMLPVLTTLMGPSTAPRWLGAPRAI